MQTKLCAHCYATIHAAAELCPRCGARQMPWIMPAPQAEVEGTLWLPVPALVVAIFTLLAVSDFMDVDWSDLSKSDKRDELTGFAFFASMSVALSIASLVTQKRGQGMAIAAMVLVALSALGEIGRVLG